jgi:hypothetical protein
LDRGERPVPRDRIIEAMRQVLQGGRLRVWELDTGRVLRSLEFCRPNRRVSFGDALVWAAVRSEDGLLYTFDRHFPDEGIVVRSELLRPAEEPPPDHE